MSTTPLTIQDSRHGLWVIRASLVKQLTEQRNQLAAICGCQGCGDADKRDPLIDLINQTKSELHHLNDRICQRPNATH